MVACTGGLSAGIELYVTYSFMVQVVSQHVNKISYFFLIR